MIEEETDTTFRLSDALIEYNPESDKDFKAHITLEKDSLIHAPISIIISKRLELDNVHFMANFITENNKDYVEGALTNIHFAKDVILNNVAALNVVNCRFTGSFRYVFMNAQLDVDERLRSPLLIIENCTFEKFNFFKGDASLNDFAINPWFRFNSFISEKQGATFSLEIAGFFNDHFSENTIKSKGGVYFRHENGTNGLDLINNTIIADHINFDMSGMMGRAAIQGNHISTNVQVAIDQLNKQDEIEWFQFKAKLISRSAFRSYYIKEKGADALFSRIDSSERKKLLSTYIDSVRYYDKNAFVNEISLKGLFYDYYKSKYDTETANKVYLELKDFETQRLKILHHQNPGFRTYFKWKVNQFLKLFSNYGTEPSKAIVMSVYVILFFALIYLFFPNSWDRHGKNRIINRYKFFGKYMSREAGIHEVYLEEKKEEMMSHEEFKQVMQSYENKIPAFFTSTAIPLYKWAISGTNLTSAFLKRVDIIQGKWSELPLSKRWWKGILLTGAFAIAIIYDLTIKMLNALMLSINTFTTLGFGEIPIKGLPRYLAIIQGFIGWFMLTIFSVSLISQLLN